MVTGSPKDPDPTKIFKQCEFHVNVLGPRKLHKKPRRKINFRYFDPLRLPGIQRTPEVHFSN